MLGRVHQGKRHGQHVAEQHCPPGQAHPAPQKHRHHGRQPGVQRRNRGHQVDTGLSRVDQDPGRLQMQRAPAAGGDALHEIVGTGLAELHGAQ